MIRYLLAGAALLAFIIFGLSLINGGSQEAVQTSTILGNSSADISGFARAVAPYDWQFPRDFGAHPDFQTEWWYYTGNLAAADGRRFGYQFTIFRRAITPLAAQTVSEWRTNQVYMAHFAVTDAGGDQYFHEARLARGAADLAGAVVDPSYRVWLEDWQVSGLNADDSRTQIAAATNGVSLDLALEQTKPPALQGDRGLSAKSDQPGNASYYYSLTRLQTDGVIRIGDESYSVSGTSWKDHEFSTSALGTNALGWDWFGLQFDDDREIMIGQIRQVDGTKDPYFGGLLVLPDGSTRYLPSNSFQIDSTGTWTSPHTGATYPAGWTVTVDMGEAQPLVFEVTPLISDQEFLGSGSAYWEGAVRLSGGVSGYGYAELTGYADSLTGRF